MCNRHPTVKKVPREASTEGEKKKKLNQKRKTVKTPKAFKTVWLSLICNNEWSGKTLDSTSRENQVCFRISVTMPKEVKLPK